MAVTATCNACGKQYQAPDELAGRQVRCKQCGATFTVPARTDPLGPEVDVDALAAMEQSVGGAPPLPQGAPAPFDIAPPAGPRPSYLLQFPGSELIDRALGPALFAGGFLWVLLASNAADADAPAWLKFVRFLVAAGAYLFLIAPLAHFMSQKAGEILRFELPRGHRFRCSAAFMPAFTLAAVLWLNGGGELSGLVIGALLGLALATAALWLLYRLRPDEIAPAGGMAAGGFLIGLALAAGILVALNTVTRNALVSAEQVGRVPGSPYAAVFEWAEAAPAPTEVARVPEPSPTPAPAEEPEPTPIEPPAATPEDPLVLQRADPAPEPAPTPAPPVRTFGARVVDAEELPLGEGLEQVIRPLTASRFVGLLRRAPEGAMEQVLEVYDDHGRREAARARFARMGGVSETYALSPDGASCARIVTFPTLSLQVWSFAEARITRVIELRSEAGAPRLLGFSNPARVLVLGEREGQSEIDVYDLRTGLRARTLRLPQMDASGHPCVLSPDGSVIAVAARSEEQSTITSMQIETGRLVARTRIELLDARWPVAPTGMAFSPDGTRIAALFEQAGNGLLVCYRVNAFGQKIAEHIYPAGPLPQAPRPFPSNALAWLDGERWLLYGRGIVEVSTGRVTDQIETVEPQRQWVADPTSVAVVERGPQGDAALVLLNLRPTSQPSPP